MNRTNTHEERWIAKRKRRKCGSSIIETLFALGLLATFISGAGKSIMMTNQLSDTAQGHYTAINIAKNQIEQVRNLRRAEFEQILALQESGIRVDETGRIDPNGNFRRATTITKDSQNDFLIEVYVKIEILNRVSRSFEGEHEELRSYIAHLL